ncbi:UNVERIFIED_CONTAM: hypothetical protein RMT77_015668 [Armadillidium vulgare]
MDFKCKIEVKEEKLDLEYDSSQVFPSKEGSLASAEGIKKEELDEKTFIKSELRESEKEFIFVELINQDVIKSENQMMVEKKFCSQNLKFHLVFPQNSPNRIQLPQTQTIVAS